MVLVRTMRCLMSPFSVHPCSLETIGNLHYSCAHVQNAETSWVFSFDCAVEPLPRIDRDLGVHQELEARTTEGHSPRGPIHRIRARSQGCLSRRILQWLGETRDTDDSRRWNGLVSGRALEGRGVSLHVCH